MDFPCRTVLHNAPVARLYEHGVIFDGELITSTGALATSSGEKTGRSPRDKRIVENPASPHDIWWGRRQHQACAEASFVSAAPTRRSTFSTRASGCTSSTASPAGIRKRRIKIRVICAGRITRCSCTTC